MPDEVDLIIARAKTNVCPGCGETGKKTAMVSVTIGRLDGEGKYLSGKGSKRMKSVSLCSKCAARAWGLLADQVDNIRSRGQMPSSYGHSSNGDRPKKTTRVPVSVFKTRADEIGIKDGDLAERIGWGRQRSQRVKQLWSQKYVNQKTALKLLEILEIDPVDVGM